MSSIIFEIYLARSDIMHIYETAIIGSGYFSLGYLLTHQNCIIIERTQLCDKNFYAPFTGFHQEEYTIENGLCRQMREHFFNLGIIKEHSFNASGFESALCSFINDKEPNILLNTDCLKISGNNGLYSIKIYNSGGLGTIHARSIIDARQETTANSINILLECVSGFNKDTFKKVFPGSTLQTAFYDGQYILKVKFKEKTNINRVKKGIYSQWKKFIPPIDTKIILMAYLMYNDNPQDIKYINPTYVKADELFFGNIFKAFDSGVQLNLGGKKYDNKLS